VFVQAIGDPHAVSEMRILAGDADLARGGMSQASFFISVRCFAIRLSRDRRRSWWWFVRQDKTTRNERVRASGLLMIGDDPNPES
jgi:hypothetical protein